MDGRRRVLKSHRLVAMNFISNPENKPEVNHIDGNKENNHVSNLEWVTTKENIRHAVKNGLISDRKGEKHNNALLTNGNVLDIMKLIGDGEKTITDIAKQFNVNRTTVSDIKRGKTWSHLTGVTKGL